jgi:hypothetical protein
MGRVNVSLSQDELEALIRLSEQQRRHPRAQVALLIRLGLEQLGLLPSLAANVHSVSSHLTPSEETDGTRHRRIA